MAKCKALTGSAVKGLSRFSYSIVSTDCSYSDFLAYTRQKKNKTYILKPENGCQGKGIWLTKSPKEIKPQEHMLCQQYLSKVGFEPFLQLDEIANSREMCFWIVVSCYVVQRNDIHDLCYQLLTL